MKLGVFLDRATIRQLTIYIFIGAFVFCVDVGTLQLFLVHGLAPTVAASISYMLGVFMHFLLNRYLNFRNFDRAMHAQARTFTVIVFLSWALTIGIIMLGTHLGLGAIASKLVAVIVCLPAGYIAHRYLTFGAGMRAAFRTRSAARAASRTEKAPRAEQVR